MKAADVPWPSSGMCTFVHPPRPRRCRPRWPLSRALRSARGSRSARTASRCTPSLPRRRPRSRRPCRRRYHHHLPSEPSHCRLARSPWCGRASAWGTRGTSTRRASSSPTSSSRRAWPRRRAGRGACTRSSRQTAPSSSSSGCRGTCFGPTTARPAWNRSSARRSFSRSGGPQRCPEASHSRSRASRRRPPSLSRAGWSHTTPRRTERSSSRATRRTATRRPAGRA
mmetsp:Transcript_31729/g.93393  ORF Transcript_31729/g.93393 Transcript_31729/m.93393 type:complete len:226 (-) Transcript_31729:253-930(-)